MTGQAQAASPSHRQFGFQLTFFISRIDGTRGMTSKFAAKKLLFAHSAITDIECKRLWYDQHIARDGFGIAQVSEADMNIKLRDWSLLSQGGQYTADLPAGDFGLKLQFTKT